MEIGPETAPPVSGRYAVLSRLRLMGCTVPPPVFVSVSCPFVTDPPLITSPAFRLIMVSNRPKPVIVTVVCVAFVPL